MSEDKWVRLAGPLAARVDAVRGDVPRARWVQRACEQVLGGGVVAPGPTEARSPRPAPAQKSRTEQFRAATQKGKKA